MSEKQVKNEKSENREQKEQKVQKVQRQQKKEQKEKIKKIEQKDLSYKGKPLTRQGNTICCGNVTDKYILVIRILETKKIKELDVGTKILVQVQSTRETMENKINVLKFAEFNSVYEALETGEYWLRRALDEAL